MSAESVSDPDIQGLISGTANDFVQRLHDLFVAFKFDIQKLVPILIEAERDKMKEQVSVVMEKERQRTDHWQAYGLPNYPPNLTSLASTPPMQTPFVDHQQLSLGLDETLATSYGDREAAFPSFDGSIPSWASASSSSSPYRFSVPHGVPSTGGYTVSPRELLSNEPPHSSSSLAGSVHYHDHDHDHHHHQNDALSMFTWSDSDNSLAACMPQPVPALPSHGRKSAHRSRTSSRSSQSLTSQQGRRPLPSGPSQATASRAFWPPLATSFGQQDHTSGGGGHQQDYQTQPDLILRSSYPTKAPSRSSSHHHHHHHHRSNPSAQRLTSRPLLSMMMQHPTSPTSPGFPPGQDQPDFVPFGRAGIASAAQGNVWPIERELFERLVAAERGHLSPLGGGGGGGGESSSSSYQRPKKLTYKEILAKYSRWDVKESTLRGIKRKITLPKEHRERVPRWSEEHINSLRLNVPLYTDRKGKISWSKVVAAIRRDTGRPFGAGTTSKKWADLTKTKTKKTAVQFARSQSGGEEGDVDEGGSSPDVSEILEVSEEDLPSHEFDFSFHRADNDFDGFGVAC